MIKSYTITILYLNCVEEVLGRHLKGDDHLFIPLNGKGIKKVNTIVQVLYALTLCSFVNCIQRLYNVFGTPKLKAKTRAYLNYTHKTRNVIVTIKTNKFTRQNDGIFTKRIAMSIGNTQNGAS